MKKIKKKTFKSVNDDKITWTICPHCNGKVYGTSRVEAIISWSTEGKSKKWKKIN